MATLPRSVFSNIICVTNCLAVIEDYVSACLGRPRRTASVAATSIFSSSPSHRVLVAHLSRATLELFEAPRHARSSRQDARDGTPSAVEPRRSECS